MECPYCGCELRLAPDHVIATGAAAGGAMAQATCASPRCARELWAELRSGGDASDTEVRLLMRPRMPPVDRPPLDKRALGEAVAALVIAVGATAFALVIGLRYVAWPDPGPVRTEAELMALAALGAVVLLAGLLIDGTLRLRGRARELPPRRVELVLLALPKGYRA